MLHFGASISIISAMFHHYTHDTLQALQAHKTQVRCPQNNQDISSWVSINVECVKKISNIHVYVSIILYNIKECVIDQVMQQMIENTVCNSCILENKYVFSCFFQNFFFIISQEFCRHHQFNYLLGISNNVKMAFATKCCL